MANPKTGLVFGISARTATAGSKHRRSCMHWPNLAKVLQYFRTRPFVQCKFVRCVSRATSRQTTKSQTDAANCRFEVNITTTKSHNFFIALNAKGVIMLQMFASSSEEYRQKYFWAFFCLCTCLAGTLLTLLLLFCKTLADVSNPFHLR